MATPKHSVGKVDILSADFPDSYGATHVDVTGTGRIFYLNYNFIILQCKYVVRAV